jgi:hypothetical protein
LLRESELQEMQKRAALYNSLSQIVMTRITVYEQTGHWPNWEHGARCGRHRGARRASLTS